MDYLISFVVSVMANIAAYIVRKWIDKQSHDKIKGRCTAIQRPFCIGWPFLLLLSWVTSTLSGKVVLGSSFSNRVDCQKM